MMQDYWNDPPELGYDDTACANCGAQLPEDPAEDTPAWEGYCDAACQAGAAMPAEEHARRAAALAEAFARDGAKWGASDLYGEAREALRAMLATGRAFQTGWYGVKKEIQSGCIAREGRNVRCEVSCSDDFDTEGHGVCTVVLDPGVSAAEALAAIETGLDRAAEFAAESLRDNAPYRGWSAGRVDPLTLVRREWTYSYIQPQGEGHYMDAPPGDIYEAWGWEDCRADSPAMPEHVREAFEEYIDSGEGDSMTLDGWRIDAWPS